MSVIEHTWDPVTDSILEETDGAGTVLASYTNEPSSYGPLISQRCESETRYLHFDALGSTRELTDDSEDVADAFTFDAWGNRFSEVDLVTRRSSGSGDWDTIATTLAILPQLHLVCDGAFTLQVRQGGRPSIRYRQ